MNIDIVGLVFVLVAILLSMTLHEAMHAFMGHWLGDDTAKVMGRLTLNPLAHIDLFTTVLLPLALVAMGAPPFGMAKPVPFDPSRVRFGEYGAALVGLAGPLTNLLLAIIGGLVLQVLVGGVPSIVISFVGIFTLVNLTFFLFNMIPFPPLDGSRLLYAFAPDPVRRVMEQIEASGLVAIGIFFVIFYMFLSEPFGRLLSVIFSFLTGDTLSL